MTVLTLLANLTFVSWITNGICHLLMDKYTSSNNTFVPLCITCFLSLSFLKMQQFWAKAKACGKEPLEQRGHIEVWELIGHRSLRRWAETWPDFNTLDTMCDKCKEEQKCHCHIFFLSESFGIMGIIVRTAVLRTLQCFWFIFPFWISYYGIMSVFYSNLIRVNKFKPVVIYLAHTSCSVCSRWCEGCHTRHDSALEGFIIKLRKLKIAK